MDKAALTRNNAGPQGLPQDDVEIPDIGTVRVRSMNRGELLHSGQLKDSKGIEAVEFYVLSSCMLDPEMTQDDVAAWYRSGGPMEPQRVLEKINALSGIGKGAAKSDVPPDGDGQPGV